MCLIKFGGKQMKMLNSRTKNCEEAQESFQNSATCYEKWKEELKLKFRLIENERKREREVLPVFEMVSKVKWSRLESWVQFEEEALSSMEFQFV